MSLPDVLNTGESVRLSRLEKKIADALTTASRPIGEALLLIRDERLYRATHKGFGQYVLDRWGFSRATAYRMIDQAAGLVPISPPKTVKPQVDLSQGETEPTEEESAHDASPAPVNSLPNAPVAEPPGLADTGAAGVAEPGPDGDGEAETTGASGGVDSPDVLTQVDVDAIGLRWLQSKNDQQVRALADPLGGAIRAEVKRWAAAFGYVPGATPAPAEKPQRRQGTITRPQAAVLAGRAIITPVNGRGKRHADDCSCLSCATPKAAAK